MGVVSNRAVSACGISIRRPFRRPLRTWIASSSPRLTCCNTPQPHQQPVQRSGPRVPAHRARQRSECRAAGSAEGPVRGLDEPAAPLARRPPQQSAHARRPLAAEGLGWSLFHHPELGRDHPHPGHRHRADDPRRSAAEHITDARPGIASLRRRRLRAHLARLLHGRIPARVPSSSDRSALGQATPSSDALSRVSMKGRSRRPDRRDGWR
jgi:hypothetical protein